MKKIYLCSPYSHPNDPDGLIKAARYIEVCKIAARLTKETGYLIFSPIAHSHGLALHGDLPGSHDFWMPIDKAFMDGCDEVWIADMVGRLTSVGILDSEIPYARETGKKVVWL